MAQVVEPPLSSRRNLRAGAVHPYRWRDGMPVWCKTTRVQLKSTAAAGLAVDQATTLRPAGPMPLAPALQSLGFAVPGRCSPGALQSPGFAPNARGGASRTARELLEARDSLSAGALGAGPQ